VVEEEGRPKEEKEQPVTQQHQTPKMRLMNVKGDKVLEFELTTKEEFNRIMEEERKRKEEQEQKGH
jgi:hypothetical protein